MYRHRDDIGQVVLLLRIVVREFAEPGFQGAGRGNQNACIHFLNGAFTFTGVFLLNDANDALIGTNNSAVAGRVFQIDRQHGELFIAGFVDQRLQSLGSGERHIAV